jgi:FtsZ-interacting cell division protein ZipA
MRAREAKLNRLKQKKNSMLPQDQDDDRDEHDTIDDEDEETDTVKRTPTPQPMSKSESAFESSKKNTEIEPTSVPIKPASVVKVAGAAAPPVPPKHDRPPSVERLAQPSISNSRPSTASQAAPSTPTKTPEFEPQKPTFKAERICRLSITVNCCDFINDILLFGTDDGLYSFDPQGTLN